MNEVLIKRMLVVHRSEVVGPFLETMSRLMGKDVRDMMEFFCASIEMTFEGLDV